MFVFYCIVNSSLYCRVCFCIFCGDQVFMYIVSFLSMIIYEALYTWMVILKAKHLQRLVFRYKNIIFSFYSQLFQRFFQIIDACLVDAIYSYAKDIQFYIHVSLCVGGSKWKQEHIWCTRVTTSCTQENKTLIQTYNWCHSLYVTGFWKTDPNRTFGISRITNLKYLTHCESLLLGCSHAKLAV